MRSTATTVLSPIDAATLRRAHGLVEDGLVEQVKEEADELGAHLREGCKAMPDPDAMAIFREVYAEEPEELAAQREGFEAYLASFEGSAH